MILVTGAAESSLRRLPICPARSAPRIGSPLEPPPPRDRRSAVDAAQPSSRQNMGQRAVLPGEQTPSVCSTDATLLAGIRIQTPLISLLACPGPAQPRQGAKQQKCRLRRAARGSGTVANPAVGRKPLANRKSGDDHKRERWVSRPSRRLPDPPGRVPGDQPGRPALRHDRVGANHAAVGDGDVAEYLCARTGLDVVSDGRCGAMRHPDHDIDMDAAGCSDPCVWVYDHRPQWARQSPGPVVFRGMVNPSRLLQFVTTRDTSSPTARVTPFDGLLSSSA